MGGFFGAVSRRDVVLDVFFGVDYHSHLGTHRGGMAAWNREEGFQRAIHSIENTPFRTKFEEDIADMRGNACIGVISDRDPQPLLIHSKLGSFAICVIGRANNAAALEAEYLSSGCGFFESQSGGQSNLTELIAALISQKSSFAEGIAWAQSRIDGTANILIYSDTEGLIAARDSRGRLPVLIGKDENGYCATFEAFAYRKLGYEDFKELGAGECVRMTAEGCETLTPPSGTPKICAFLYTYFGYPNSQYEGATVELVRNRGGALLAQQDRERGLAQDLDAVCGVPDSGVAYAVGYATEGGVPFTRPFIKYTPTWPRSFMPDNPDVRHRIAKMKMIPVPELIKGKKLLFTDDSIVRGTQLQETVRFLSENGAAEIHMRSACPPIMYGCKYLRFARHTSDMDLIARRTVQQLEGEEGQTHLEEYADGGTQRGKAMRRCICQQFGFSTLEYQSIENLIEAIGIGKENICTYCWTGEE